MMNTTYTQFHAPEQRCFEFGLATYQVTAYCPLLKDRLIVAEFPYYGGESPNKEHHRAQAEALAEKFFLEQTTRWYPFGCLVPILDNDHKENLSESELAERRTVANVLDHLRLAGFYPVIVYDGEVREKVLDMKSAMEVVFSVEASAIAVQKEGGKKHWLNVILGNGHECVADWADPDGDPEGFAKAMNEIDFDKFQ